MNQIDVNKTQALTFKCDLHMERRRHGRLEMRCGRAPQKPSLPLGRVPRVARLMALAIRFDDLIRRGEVSDYADLARLAHVTRARVTQIMNLLMLAPDIQEEILFLPKVEAGCDPVKEVQLRPVSAALVWKDQRRLWNRINLTAG